MLAGLTKQALPKRMRAMTKHLFDVVVSGVHEIHDMPGTWSDDDYRQLLTQLEVDGVEDVSGSDLLEMALMALQDMEADAAADTVLAHKLGSRISAGARRNIVEDLLEDQRPWEEAADISLHAQIFAAAVLLQKAFPSSFARPDMMKVVLDITALTPAPKAVLSTPPQAAFVTRLLADAMDTHSILERLFDEQLLSHNFPEADGIIWLAEFSDQASDEHSSVKLAIYSSQHWLDAMATISAFESSAYNDDDLEEADHG